VRDSQGRTPLMAAAMNRQLQAVRVLVRHGADINAVDLDGYSVLALVSVLGGTTGAMESYLESRGAVLCVPWNIVDCPSKSMRDLEDFKTALALSALPE
jgi:ankyrin repeat protein